MMQVCLCPLDDFCMQISGEFIPNLQNADRITHRRDHVHEYDLGAKMAGQECGLTNRVELGVRNGNWKKNLIYEYVHFHSEVRESGLATASSKIFCKWAHA